MQCQHAQEYFSDYVTGEMDRALKVSLENHLAACASCREEVTGLRRVWTSLDQLPRVDLPPFFHENLMGRLAAEHAEAEEAAARKRALWDWRALFRPRALAFAATALVVMLACMEVVQTQRAELGPIDWLIKRAAPPAEIGLQSQRAEWLSDGQGRGTLIVHLQALPAANASVNHLSYSVKVAGHKTPDAQGMISSEKETVLSLPLNESLSGSSPSLLVTLTAVDGNASSDQKIIRLPIVSVVPIAPDVSQPADSNAHRPVAPTP